MCMILKPFRTALVCALTVGLSTSALAGDIPGMKSHETDNFKVARLGDTNMDCNALSREAARMQTIIAHKQAIQDDAEMKTRGIQAAGAVGSVVLGAATAGIGLGVAGFLASEAISEEADAADTIQDSAAERRSFMVGIYNAKGCAGPIEHAMIDIETENLLTELSSLSPAAGDEGDPRTVPARYAYETPPDRGPDNVPQFGTAQPRNNQFND